MGVDALHLSLCRGGGGTGNFRVLFWEQSSGGRFEPPTALGAAARIAVRCPFVRIACVFSGDRFFAVSAGDDSVGYLNTRSGWSFEDATSAAWKQMESALLAALPHSPAPPLAHPTLPGADVAEALEASLSRALTAARAGQVQKLTLGKSRAALAHAAGDATVDPHDVGALPAHATPVSLRLSALLGQALVAYEAVSRGGEGEERSEAKRSEANHLRACFASEAKRPTPLACCARLLPAREATRLHMALA